MVKLHLPRRLGVGLRRLYRKDVQASKPSKAINNLYKNDVYYNNILPDRFHLQLGLREKSSHSLVEKVSHATDMSSLKITTQPQQNVPIKQFYRRQLPETCISFCSTEGQELFKEALSAGHMQCYFKLAAQFRTQDEPAFCGLSTLVMVLNSLAVDPGKVWKGCWRWYHEEMLDCCEPLQDVKERGINFDQFICLAYCNYLEASTVRGEQDMSEDLFRQTIKDYTKREDAFIVASYSRRTLGQTGEGHFSPIAGYHPGKDLALILDVARFKYPPHWVSVKLLADAMKELDMSTGKARGYTALSKIREQLPLLVFRVSSALAVTKEEQISKEVRSCIKKWNTWLSENKIVNGKDKELHYIVESIKEIIEMLSILPDECNFLTTQVDITCDGVSCEHICAVCHLLKDIECTELYKIAKNNMTKEIFNQKVTKIGAMALLPENVCSKMDSCMQLSDINPSHFLTMLLLSWPYDKEHETYANALRHYTNNIIDNSTSLVKNEILNLRKQLATVFSLNSCCCKNSCNKS